MMLDGTYEPPDEVDEYTKKLICQFGQNHKAQEHDPKYKVTAEEWKGFFKGATERTSCGLDILYFCTCKAGAHNYIKAELDALLTDIPMKMGYSPNRWRLSIDALLLRKSDVTLVEKL
jgi:hypothetical protein